MNRDSSGVKTWRSYPWFLGRGKVRLPWGRFSRETVLQNFSTRILCPGMNAVAGELYVCPDYLTGASINFPTPSCSSMS